MEKNVSPVVAFGKIIFIPTHESVPALPEMSLLFFKEDERGEVFPWRAVCIDLELDACGNSMAEAWESLKESLTAYIAMEKEVAEGSIKEAAKNIIKTAFTESEQKSKYVTIYRQAKLEYTIEAIDSGRITDPIQEEKQRIEKLESEKESIRSIITELKAA